MKRKCVDLTEGPDTESLVDQLKWKSLQAPNKGWMEYCGHGEIFIDEDVTTFIWWYFDGDDLEHSCMLNYLLTESHIWIGNKTIPNPLNCVVTVREQTTLTRREWCRDILSKSSLWGRLKKVRWSWKRAAWALWLACCFYTLARWLSSEGAA